MATVSIDWIHFAITSCILTSIDHMIISPFSFDEARSRPSGENNSEWTDFEHLRIRFCFISSASNGFHTTIDPSCNPLAIIIVINEVQRIETETPFLVEIVLDGSSTITTVLWVHGWIESSWIVSTWPFYFHVLPLGVVPLFLFICQKRPPSQVNSELVTIFQDVALNKFPRYSPSDCQIIFVGFVRCPVRTPRQTRTMDIDLQSTDGLFTVHRPNLQKERRVT